MAKFIKRFSGCKDGEIYPTEFQPDDECPPELEAAALSVGALAMKPNKKAAKAAPENK
jgi:hypothetical protein